MNFENSVIVEKKLFEEYSQGIDLDKVEWIKRRIIEKNPDWLKFEDKTQLEYYVLHELNYLLFSIQKDNPPDIHAYVEKQLKIQSYLGEAERLRNLVLTIVPGNKKQYGGIKGKLDEFEKRFDAEKLEDEEAVHGIHLLLKSARLNLDHWYRGGKGDIYIR